MEAFFISTLAITLGEIGDKTQLLALMLALRFKRSTPIILGILCATLANHLLAAWFGQWLAQHISATTLKYILSASFLAIAAWTLIPDKLENAALEKNDYGVFLLTCLTFFLAEMGDKTQLATVALAAKYQALFLVLAGTTLGMLIADIPAVILGKLAAPNFPFKLVRMIAAAIFAALGVAVLLVELAPHP